MRIKTFRKFALRSFFFRNYVIESTQSANEFVDGIMGSVKKILNEKFHDRIKIPNITEIFERKILILTWRGSFKAHGGTVRGLATVTRSGDTEFASDNASQTHFFGNLHFEQLDVSLFYQMTSLSYFYIFFFCFTNIASLRSLQSRIHEIRA